MNGTETSASVYAGAIPSPEKRAFIGRNIFGGSTSVGGTSPAAGSRRRYPQEDSRAQAFSRSTCVSGSQPETYATAPSLCISSFAAAKAILSASSGNSATIALSSARARREADAAISPSSAESSPRMAESPFSGRGSGNSATARMSTPSAISFLARSGSKSP